jgi:hypothetical protein
MKALAQIKNYIVKLFTIDFDFDVEIDCNFEKEIFKQLSKYCEL